jgi:hypothetical protein
MDANLEQSSKGFTPRVVTLAGIVMEVSPEQLKKA